MRPLPRKSEKKFALVGQPCLYDKSFARRKFNEQHPRKAFRGIKALRPLFRVFTGRCAS